MKELKIKSLTCNLASNITQVEVQIFSVNGAIKRLEDSLELEIQGRFTGIDDALIEAVTEVLEANGVML